jgi:hypothetical protein
MIPYKPPQSGEEAFNCPHCNAYASQTWSRVRAQPLSGGDLTTVPDLKIVFCTHCKNYTIWRSQEMLYPEYSGVQPPNPDLMDDIKEDYLEATSIANKSPRGAAALLRLCIQKLCKQLGEKGENLNTDIANLVKKGLPIGIQQALDIVRVIGNNAVHPGQIDIKDDRDTAMKLLDLINLIAAVMITQPKQVEKLYNSLPESEREKIQKRDKGDLQTGR